MKKFSTNLIAALRDHMESIKTLTNQIKSLTEIIETVENEERKKEFISIKNDIVSTINKLTHEMSVIANKV